MKDCSTMIKYRRHSSGIRCSRKTIGTVHVIINNISGYHNVELSAEIEKNTLCMALCFKQNEKHLIKKVTHQLKILCNKYEHFQDQQLPDQLHFNTAL